MCIRYRNHPACALPQLLPCRQDSLTIGEPWLSQIHQRLNNHQLGIFKSYVPEVDSPDDYDVRHDCWRQRLGFGKARMFEISCCLSKHTMRKGLCSILQIKDLNLCITHGKNLKISPLSNLLSLPPCMSRRVMHVTRLWSFPFRCDFPRSFLEDPHQDYC